jgi:hypothetical protein
VRGNLSVITIIVNDNILIIIIIHIDVPCPGLYIMYPALWSERNEVVTMITNKKHSSI